MIYLLLKLRFLGEAIATTVSYNGWAKQRKVNAHMFSHTQVLTYIDEVNQVVDKLLDDLKKFAESGEKFYLARYIGRMTLDVILYVCDLIDHNYRFVKNIIGRQQNGCTWLWDIVFHADRVILSKAHAFL